MHASFTSEGCESTSVMDLRHTAGLPEARWWAHASVMNSLLPHSEHTMLLLRYERQHPRKFDLKPLRKTESCPACSFNTHGQLKLPFDYSEAFTANSFYITGHGACLMFNLFAESVTVSGSSSLLSLGRARHLCLQFHRYIYGPKRGF